MLDMSGQEPVDQVNLTNSSTPASPSTPPTIATVLSTQPHPPSSGISELMIPLYILIFLLAVVGNAVVLTTLAKNKSMRTVTNVYLLNLAVADILLGVFCMPFTLLGQILRNFVFGPIMCKLIPYFQAVSVSVAVWTLVAISLERYFAICRPLKSRRWQTQFHAYKMIAIVWMTSLVWNSPILFVSRLIAMRERGRHKCREEWGSLYSERGYNLFLDTILLLVPLLIMSLAYSLIVSKLWKGLQREIRDNPYSLKNHRSVSMPTMTEVVIDNHVTNGNGEATHRLVKTPTSAKSASTTLGSIKMWLLKCDGLQRSGERTKPSRAATGVQGEVSLPLVEAPQGAESPDLTQDTAVTSENTSNCVMPKYVFTRQAIRSNYMDKSIEAKKKVIRMLFVVVAEFFVCWAPLHVLNTWYLFSPEVVYRYVGSTGVSLVQLLAYISSCCNPITYCFMNRKFRQAFLSLFNCPKWCCFGEECSGTRRLDGTAGPNNSEVSANDSTVYVGRACRSEVVMLEKDERV